MCLSGEIGRRTGLKILRESNPMPVQVRPQAPFILEKYPSLVEGTGLENREVGDDAGVRIPLSPPSYYIYIAGQSSLVARWAHNPKVVGSNPSPATKWFRGVAVITSACHAEDREFDSRRNRHFGFIAQSVEQRTENPCVAGSIPAGATIFLLITKHEFVWFLFC